MQILSAQPSPGEMLRAPVKDSVKVVQLLTEGKKLSAAQDRKCFAYLDPCIKLCNEKTTLFYIESRCQALHSYAHYYMNTGVYDTARYYENQVLALAVKHKQPLYVAKAQMALGILADYQSDYETSVQKNLLALGYFEKVKDTMGIASSMGNLGNSYIRLKQHNKAIDYLDEAIRLATLKKEKKLIANLSSSLARAYKGLGNKQKELELKLKAFNMFKDVGFKRGMETVAINLGNYYENENQLDESLKYYGIALDNAWQIRDVGNIATLYNNMSDLYVKLDQFPKALMCIDSAEYYARKSGDRLAYSDAVLGKAELLNMQGKSAEAFQVLQHYTDLKDSIFNEKLQRKVADMEVQYETRQKEDRIALLHHENEIKELLLSNQRLTISGKELELKNKNGELNSQRLDALRKEQNIRDLKERNTIQQLELANQQLTVNQQRMLMILFVLMLAGGALLAFSFYRRYKWKKEKELQAAVFRQQELATKEVYEKEQQERIRIARDLHDSIGQMLAVVKMQLSGQLYNEPDNTATGQTLKLVDETITEVRSISHNLIPEELNFGLVNALETLCGKINDAGMITMKLEVTDAIRPAEVELQTALAVYRAVQEITGNMLKHAQADTIQICLDKKEQTMYVVVSDNGKGFDVRHLSDTNGIGWKNIAARVHLLNGQMEVHSYPDKGTEVIMQIPL